MNRMRAEQLADESIALSHTFAKAITKGTTLASVVNGCLILCVYTAKQAQMDKLEIQKLFVTIWDKTGAP